MKYRIGLRAGWEPVYFSFILNDFLMFCFLWPSSLFFQTMISSSKMCKKNGVLAGQSCLVADGRHGRKTCAATGRCWRKGFERHGRHNQMASQNFWLKKTIFDTSPISYVNYFSSWSCGRLWEKCDAVFVLRRIYWLANLCCSCSQPQRFSTANVKLGMVPSSFDSLLPRETSALAQHHSQEGW